MGDRDGPNGWLIGVVGSGTMGAGIAQVALEAGHEVAIYDVDAEATRGGRQRIKDGLRRRMTKLGYRGIRCPRRTLDGLPSISPAEESVWVNCFCSTF